MTDPTPAAVARALLAWAHAGNLRELPWRIQPRDPYVVWVSEIMLQQTQAATVAPYLGRWLARFPTLGDLARASQGEVLKAWEGLGYYSRARNLHRAARLVQANHGGQLPTERKDLLALPGIGRYTAGAILSLAHGQRAAAVDGNVKRVLARVYDIEQEIDRSATATRLWKLAEEQVAAVAPKQAGTLNEALMDLGATCCTPRSPQCSSCPLSQICLARQRDTQGERPVRRPRKALPHVDVTAAILERPAAEHSSPQVLIAQRPPDGMLGGLWEFPGGKRHDGESLAACLRRELQEELGIEVAVGDPVISIDHAYTHFRITLHAFRCRLVSGDPQALGVADWRWVTLDELDQYPFPVTDQKIIQALTA